MMSRHVQPVDRISALSKVCLLLSPDNIYSQPELSLLAVALCALHCCRYSSSSHLEIVWSLVNLPVSRTAKPRGQGRWLMAHHSGTKQLPFAITISQWCQAGTMAFQHQQLPPDIFTEFALASNIRVVGTHPTGELRALFIKATQPTLPPAANTPRVWAHCWYVLLMSGPAFFLILKSEAPSERQCGGLSNS